MYDVDLPTARDCMTTRARVLAFSPEEDVLEAMAELLARHFAAAPVVDADERVVGMLTEKDCLRILANLAYDDDFDGGQVKDYQSPMRLHGRTGSGRSVAQKSEKGTVKTARGTLSKKRLTSQ